MADDTISPSAFGRKLSLLSRFLMLDNEDGWTVSRFAEQIDDMHYLMAPHSPHTGEELPGGLFVVHIGMLALLPEEDPVFPRAKIFPTWEMLRRYVDGWDDDKPAERVVKLVPHQDQKKP